MTIPKPPAERFWARVDKTETCWNWTGSRSPKGYGRFGVAQKRTAAVHRFSYEIAFGPIPAGAVIDHICHNPACVNPSHLRPVTPKKNNENRLGANKNSASGVRGVFWSKQKKRWLAQVTHNRKLIHAGFHMSIKDAESAVIAKRLELFTHNDADRKAA